jgi:hypothetical protein
MVGKRSLCFNEGSTLRRVSGGGRERAAFSLAQVGCSAHSNSNSKRRM